MKLKLFWKIRAIQLKCQFLLRKIMYQFNGKIEDRKRKVPFAFLTSKVIIRQTTKNLLLAGILLWADSVFISILEKKAAESNLNFLYLDLEIATNILLGGMGVAGVILGLYCSNITSTYSTKYANAPTNLAAIFQRDIITNKSIQQIVGYIILCLILLGACIFHFNISYISLVVMLVMTIRIAIIFSIAGNRTNTLSNTYQISENIYPEILVALKHVSGKSFYASDKSFQAHFQKICSNKLNDLKDISLFNKDNPSNQNAATFLFMSKNIALLDYYWEVKRIIRYDSLWYRDKVQYEPWHFASDHNVDLALKTGTSPQPKTVRDYWWLESEIEQINEICFEKLCRDGDFETILKYINLLSSLSFHAIDSGDILSWIHIIAKLQTHFTSLYFNSTLSEENNQITASICAVFVATYISVLIGVNDYLGELDLRSILNDIVTISSQKDADITLNRLFNNQITEDILHRISVEIKLEGKKITPDWYLKQVSSKYIISFFNDLLENIVIICDNVIEFGTVFLKKKQYFQAAVIFSQFLQFMSKSKLTIATMDRNFNILHQQYIEPTIVWEDSKLDSAKQKIEAMQKQLPQLLVKCGGAFALTHWSKREDYPDLLGFCYNHICEALISSIEENDFETFKGAYSGFLAIMLLYQEYIRTDVIKIKEPHRQQGVFHVATAPIIEYAMISGFAILWGEFNHSPQWGELITTELQRFIKEDEDNHSVTLKRITEMATARKHHMFGIGNRDVLQTGWKQRIERAIRNSGLCEYEYKSFGQKVLKTDSKLLKIFCGISFSDMGFTYDVEDIYFICCVNPYMPPESRYIGDFKWEEDLDED